MHHHRVRRRLESFGNLVVIYGWVGKINLVIWQSGACILRIALRFPTPYVGLLNQGLYWENAMQCGKRTRKQDVATRLKNFAEEEKFYELGEDNVWSA